MAVAARIGVPHNTIHRILREKGMAAGHPKMSRRRERIRRERTHSNTVWHADCKLLPDGKWSAAHQDDASGFIAGHGVFGEAAGEHALVVPGRAMPGAAGPPPQ